MAEMTFWDHLDELRKVLFRVVGVSYSTIYYGISAKHLI